MRLPFLLLPVILWAAPAAAAVIMQVPGGTYRSASDSPYFDQLQAEQAYLNDFSQDEDGYYWVNDAGQTVWHEYSNEQYTVSQVLRWEFARRDFNSARGPGAENVSVDGDDGAVDGWSDGHWGLTGDGFQSTPSLDIYFARTFVLPDEHPVYPQWVGFVMTITGPESSGGQPIRAPQVDILGVNGNVMGSFSLFDLRADMIAANAPGRPGQIQRVFNDRAVFFHSDEPIARLKIYNGIYLDHLQWGYSTVYVPEPGAAGLAAVAGLALLRQRRRR
jgi:MYXO-CTERM domain-containing protein